MRKLTTLLAAAAATVLLPGCAAITGPTGALMGEPYTATRCDIELIQDGFGIVPSYVGWIDLPFSLAVDTGLLPLTLTSRVINGEFVGSRD